LRQKEYNSWNRLLCFLQMNEVLVSVTESVATKTICVGITCDIRIDFESVYKEYEQNTWKPIAYSL